MARVLLPQRVLEDRIHDHDGLIGGLGSFQRPVGQGEHREGTGHEVVLGVHPALLGERFWSGAGLPALREGLQSIVAGRRRTRSGMQATSNKKDECDANDEAAWIHGTSGIPHSRDPPPAGTVPLHAPSGRNPGPNGRKAVYITVP